MILDTDILVDIIRKHPPAITWLRSQSTLPAICGNSALELVYGCKDLRELRAIHAFLEDFSLVWPTAADHQVALTEFARLRLSHGLGLMDALIAATALGIDESAGTFNVKHFRSISSITTVQPYVC